MQESRPFRAAFLITGSFKGDGSYLLLTRTEHLSNHSPDALPKRVGDEMDIE